MKLASWDFILTSLYSGFHSFLYLSLAKKSMYRCQRGAKLAAGYCAFSHAFTRAETIGCVCFSDTGKRKIKFKTASRRRATARNEIDDMYHGDLEIGRPKPSSHIKHQSVERRQTSRLGNIYYEKRL